MQSKIAIIPIVRNLPITTDGVSQSVSVLDLSPTAFKNILPHAEGLTLYWLTTGRAAGNTDLEWAVFFLSGFDRDHEGPAVDVLGQSGGNDVYITQGGVGRSTAEFTDKTNFQLESRLQVRWRNKSGVNTPQSGVISAALAVRTYGT